MEPTKLRTSELLRTAASRLDAGSRDDQQVAFELRVRARWIEGARADEGVSHDRRMGIAAIEDVEASAPDGRVA
jgi:hypothetical protein